MVEAVNITSLACPYCGDVYTAGITPSIHERTCRVLRASKKCKASCPRRHKCMMGSITCHGATSYIEMPGHSEPRAGLPVYTCPGCGYNLHLENKKMLLYLTCPGCGEQHHVTNFEV